MAPHDTFQIKTLLLHRDRWHFASLPIEPTRMLCAGQWFFAVKYGPIPGVVKLFLYDITLCIT
jgi:hypothetical protein